MFKKFLLSFLVLGLLAGCSGVNLGQIPSELPPGEVLTLSTRSTVAILTAVFKGHYNGIIMVKDNYLAVFWPSVRGVAFWFFDTTDIKAYKDWTAIKLAIGQAGTGNPKDLAEFQRWMLNNGWKVTTAGAMNQYIKAKMLDFLSITAGMTTFYLVLVPTNVAKLGVKGAVDSICLDAYNNIMCTFDGQKIVVPEFDT